MFSASRIILVVYFITFVFVGVHSQQQQQQVPTVNHDIFCEARVFEPKCPEGGGTVSVISAFYGNTNSLFCYGNDVNIWSSLCSRDITANLRGACANRNTCSVTVDGQDVCNGGTRYLEVRWTCDNGLGQTTNNNRNKNILVSLNANRRDGVPLHRLNVGGNSLYVFLDPPEGVAQVRFYLDDTARVFTTETAAPWDFLGGRPWQTIGAITNGQHRIAASITFDDGDYGVVDAIFFVRNDDAPARATSAAPDAFSAMNNGTVTVIRTNNHVVPWSLFGVLCTVIVGLVVSLVILNVRGKREERI